jgi:hypothetical protein
VRDFSLAARFCTPASRGLDGRHCPDARGADAIASAHVAKFQEALGRQYNGAEAAATLADDGDDAKLLLQLLAERILWKDFGRLESCSRVRMVEKIS